MNAISFTRLDHGKDLPAPEYATPGSAGMDLVAAVPANEPMKILPGSRAAVPTGLAFAIPQGFEGQVRPRSGLALKNGVTVLNAPGTIDSDYRGEVKVILVNTSDETFEITRGMRIAQIIFARVEQMHLQEVNSLDETARGSGGFGSTGVQSSRKSA
ncbi:MAG: dUTP diphosphatase [Xanthobacteraceae bacterium]|nr:dUTP diphosphatase [Xanthobacteraceae bacterium]MCW5673314.1 dUTP diphosphatase [Xanthobacteraceae bacterium]